MKEKNTFKDWSKVIKNIQTNTPEPMWDQAIKHLISECAMEPTMAMELSQGQIQEIILESYDGGILDLFQDFGRWIGVSMSQSLSKGNEIWLAYLMATRYAMQWDGENWVCVTAQEGKG